MGGVFCSLGSNGLGMGLSTHKTRFRGVWHRAGDDGQQDVVCRHTIFAFGLYNIACRQVGRQVFQCVGHWRVALHLFLWLAEHIVALCIFLYRLVAQLWREGCNPQLAWCLYACVACLDLVVAIVVGLVLACIFFKSDKLTMRKSLGCLVGFMGVLALNLGGGASGEFTLMGDGMIILNALCSAFAGLMTRGLGRRADVFVATGYSLAVGGLFLVIPGLLLGGCLPVVSWWGVAILAMLIGISSMGFTLYNKLLSCNPVGKVAIFNSLIPVVGAVTSCLCLGEPFYWRYLLAACLATCGIYIINKGKK